MKVLGYVMLHYGLEYLEYALIPLCEVCDKVIILYSLNPSHNGKDQQVNMETRRELMIIAAKFEKVEWVDVYNCYDEGTHRNEIFKHSQKYDVLVNADYDEVWDVDDLGRAVVECYNSPYRNHGIDGFIHFWKSFRYVAANYKILQDDGRYLEGKESDLFRPHRLIHLREKNTVRQPDIKAKIYHFGYAIQRRKMTYKLSIHGHRSEWDKTWFETWRSWQPSRKKGKFHPVSKEVWLNIKQFDHTKLPKIMKSHPYYNLNMI